MNLGDSIRAGVKWLFLGSVGTQFLQFAFGIALARLLVPADFGMIVSIHVFTGFVGMLMSGGMGQSLIRAKEVSSDDFNAVFTMQIAIGILIYVGFFASAPWIATYLHDPIYADLLRVSALSFILRPLSFVRISWLNRAMEFKKRAQIELIGTALTAPASVLMAWAGMGVWSLIFSGLLGAFVSNILLSRATPLRLRLHVHMETVRKHSAYGFKITAGDLLTHLIEQSVNLILSKLAGPGFLGIFNKAESLARTANRLITPPTSQTIFRAMSKVQDDLDQSKYLFFRTITLLLVYICPFLVGMWWIADPFIGFVYGEKWLPVVEPLKILILVGFLRTVSAPSWVLLSAQNRLTQLLIAQVVGFIFAIAACLTGLNWGLRGVAWGSVATTAYFAAYFYILVRKTIPTRMTDLLRAIAPGLFLGTLLFVGLAIVHFLVVNLRTSYPLLYLTAMIVAGSVLYTAAFLFVPIPALRSEAARWRQKISGGLDLIIAKST
jgi:O-antigen/teichoic acid export membrane protein